MWDLQRVAHVARKAWSPRGIRASICTAIALLAWDVVVTGSFVFSWLVCPIWLLASVVKNAIERPGWGLALLRLAIPALTLGLVMANNAYQLKNAEENAARIIAACEEFHAANGAYPNHLDELVPRYMSSVPRAKHCLSWGDFLYWNNGRPMLVWWVVPPYGRKHYDFQERRWGYLD